MSRPFLKVFENLFSSEECQNLIQKVEDKNEWEHVDRGMAEYERVIMVDKKLANELFEKIKSELPEYFTGLRIVGLNDHFRFSKYYPRNSFGIHRDGMNVDSQGNRSVMTLNIFLNDVEEGGGTIFYYDNDRQLLMKNVRPKSGTGALFFNQIYHEGELVKKGNKYLIRTDVMASIY
jgi:predicted 2-oxoglutarate/Fe(II)-dependent dioxygenase YbiX